MFASRRQFSRYDFRERAPACSTRSSRDLVTLPVSFFLGRNLFPKKETGVGRRAASFLRGLAGGVGFVSEIRLQRVLELAQRRDQRLQREVSRPVGRVHAGHVLELARLADVALGRQHHLLRRLLLLLLARHRQTDVFRAGHETLDVLPEIVRSFRIVEAEPGEAGVIRRETHRVEGRSGDLRTFRKNSHLRAVSHRFSIQQVQYASFVFEVNKIFKERKKKQYV